jgi:hypothetical protein
MSKYWFMGAMVAWAGVVLAAGGPAAAADDEAGFQSLFDGKSLDGWEGKSEFWSVREGAIVGQTTKEQPTKGNTFLIWRGGKPADFELRIKWRFGGDLGNSGIQYRSVDYGDSVAGGYQADMDAGHGYTGILYEERGRGILARRCLKTVIGEDGKKTEAEDRTCDEKALLDSVKKGQWNEWVITAQGNHLVQKLNGFVTVDVTDEQVAKRRMDGVIALQLHAGPPMSIEFKDIRLKILK